MSNRPDPSADIHVAVNQEAFAARAVVLLQLFLSISEIPVLVLRRTTQILACEEIEYSWHFFGSQEERLCLVFHDLFRQNLCCMHE